MKPNVDALQLFDSWYQRLIKRSGAGGTPRGTIGAALVVLERLETRWEPDILAQLARQKGQIRGASGSALKRILAKFDEHRPFLREGGRTNRGVPGDIENMLEALRGAGLDRLDQGARVEILRVLEGARQNAEQGEPGRISVDSIEAFVGGNIDEMSMFSRERVVEQFRSMLEIYNSRVNEIENDKSMMIGVPPRLLRKRDTPAIDVGRIVGTCRPPGCWPTASGLTASMETSASPRS